MNPSQIMIVEDESIVAMDIQEALRDAHYEVAGVVGTGREALERAEKARPDLVLMDIHLKGEMDGVQAAREIRERLDIPVIYLTAYSDERTLQRAKMTEPFGYLLKPFEKEDIQSAIEMALHKHRTEKTIKESRRWLESILRGAGEAIVAMNARGLITFMNPVAEKLTGTLTWASAPFWREAVKFRAGGDALSVLVKSFEEGVAAEFPPGLEVVAQDGSARPVDGLLTPARDEKGGVAGFVLSFRDITARRRLEGDLKKANTELEQRIKEEGEALLETHRELQRQVKEVESLYKYAPCGYHSLDGDAVVVRMNQTELSWLGLKSADVLGKPFVDFISPESRPLFIDNLSIFRERGWLKNVQYQMRRGDGTSFPVMLNFTRVKEEDGSCVMTRVTVYNLTEKKRSEKALLESEAKFRCIADLAAEGILLADEKGIISYANRSARELFGLVEEGIVGQSADVLVPLRERPRFRKFLQSLSSLSPGESTGTVAGLKGYDRGGREFPVEASVSTWIADDRRYYAGILRDVSKSRRLEAALLHAGKLSAMGQMAAGLAHELKTPLGTIYSFADLLLSKRQDPDTGQTLETIRNQSLRCSALIDNLLDFARRHTISKEESADLDDVVESALSMVQSHAKTRGVSVVREQAPGALTVGGAKNMLEQVVVNLCMNAVDAMPNGGTLTVRVGLQDSGGSFHGKIDVVDTGTGIEPALQEKIFEPFQTTKAPGQGTGLGLWLSGEIVKGLGGAITCRSEPGRGSIFTVELPLRDPAVPAEEAS